MPADCRSNYIGLAVNNNVLRAVIINSRKKKITNFVEVKLDYDILNGGTFLKPEAFKSALEQLLEKTKTPPRCISVSLPERYALTRELAFPNITEEEVAEAVNWQARNIFPLPLEDMYLDWKSLVGQNNEKEVFVVAIPKKLVDDLVSILSDLRLKPINIQTSASCLGRMLPKNGKNVQILTSVNEDGATATLVANNVAKMTVTPNAEEETIDIIQKLIEYYKAKHSDKFKIAKIWLTGDKVTDDLKIKISETLNIETGYLRLPVLLQDKDKSLAFSEAIAIGFAPIEPPESSKTINLLPGNIQNLYEVSKDYYSLKNVFHALSGLLMTLLLVSAFSYGYLIYRAREFNIENKIQPLLEEGNTETELRKLNKEVDKLNILTKKKQTPKALISNLPQLIPLGISLNFWEYNQVKKQLVLEGKTDSRDTLIEFQESLENRPEYGRATIPLDSLSKKSNFQFRLVVELN
jgi:Tfp pilus assembly PilM family ATPase